MKNSIDCYIPARLGSLRVPAKNLRILGDRPLIAHTIRTLKQVKNISSFCVNTESAIIADVATRYESNVYIRDPNLASSDTSTDDIIYNYAINSMADNILIVNPTAPFLKSSSIDAAAQHFIKTRRSLFSSNQIRRHALFRGAPLNFSSHRKSPRTQELEPIALINFIFIFLNKAEVIAAYERQGYCLYSSDMQLWPLDGLEAWDIDDEFDFQLAQWAISKHGHQEPEYAPEVAAMIKLGARFES
ncbi:MULTISPECIES: hypothetical protein [unclassified Brevundimonas]|uniref:acylneuraminate cytidylyltransferase family protein n=1 Tax=unclassified Brevundimonas TaxID=2622653 RepID=UPI0020055D23|nr:MULTISPECIES: hypothetical protein [unclassified Brevundimonas]MCK6104979.1 hypothetical protein [Brevundimonas sp. EYE_349]MCW0046918.1 hypothetical protein [Brevundimonas sp. BT-123]